MSPFSKFCPSDAFLLVTANVLVQIAVVVALAGAISLVFARHRAAVRHAIWLVAFVCTLLSPAAAYLAARAEWPLVSLRLLPRLPSPIGRGARGEGSGGEKTPVVLSDATSPHPNPLPKGEGTELLPSPVGRGARGEGSGGEKTPVVLSDATSPHPNPLPKGEGTELLPSPVGRGAGGEGSGDAWRTAIGLAAVLWIVGASILFLRLLHGCWHIVGLRRRLQPIDGGQLAVLSDVRRILNTKELPPLAMLPRATALAGPITVGLFRPLVIVPEDVLATLDSRGLRDVLIHEFAHAVRRDPLVGFVQRLAAVVYWPYPPVHFLNRRLALAREEVCDNYVLREGDAPSYAETLLAISQSFFSKRPHPTALGLFHPYGRLERRVVELLNPRRNVMVRTHRVTLALLAVLFVIAAVAVAGTRLLQAEPPPSPAAPIVAPPASKRSIERGTVHKPVKRYSDVVTLDYSGGGDGGIGFARLPTGYTVVTLSGESASTTQVAVSFAREATASSSTTFRVVAIDKRNRLHEPISENSAMGGGAKSQVVTIVSKFSLPQKDIVKLIVQQSGEPVPAHELSMVSLPPYEVEPPDVLKIEMLKPKLPKRPGNWFANGEYLVGPDGTVNLRQFGTLRVAGKTLTEIRTELNKHLSQFFFEAPDVSVEVHQFNSKVFYVFTERADGGGSIRRVPMTGNHTVLDALSEVNGLSPASIAKIWIARLAPGGVGSGQKLPVDYDAITRGASTATNYQIMPGDRVFVVTKPEAQITRVSPVVPAESEPSSSKSSEASYSIIQPFDMLRIDAIGTLTDQPIDDSYLVYPDGQVALGPAYGRVKVDGLTWEEAERRITQHLKKTLTKPEVQVALARRGPSPETALLPSFPYKIRVWDVLSVIAIGTIKDQPIDGFYLVEPGGQVALGPTYGRVDVNGLTCEQAERRIAGHLKRVLTNPEVQVTPARRGGPWREAVLPKTPYKIGVWDVLQVRAIGTLIDQPIDAYFLVESTGTLAFGPAYGRVQVKGMTLDEAQVAIEMKLRQVLVKPEVQVTLSRQADQKQQWQETTPPKAPYTIRPGTLLYINVAGTLLDALIDGIYTVEPTGAVALGPAYGRAQVNGLTLEAAEKAIRTRLQEVLSKPEVQVTFGGWQQENDPLLREQAERRAAKQRRLEAEKAEKEKWKSQPRCYVEPLIPTRTENDGREREQRAQQEKKDKEELDRAIKQGPTPEHYTPPAN